VRANVAYTITQPIEIEKLTRCPATLGRMIADDFGILISHFGNTSAQNRKINVGGGGQGPPRRRSMKTTRFVNEIANQRLNKLYGVGQNRNGRLEESV